MKEGLSLILKDKWLELKGTICPKSVPWMIDDSVIDPYDGKNLIEVPSRIQYELSMCSPDIIFICVYATYITIKANKSSTQLFGKDIYLKKLLDKLRLTRWDKVFKREILLWRFYAYNNKLSEFILPRYALKELIKCIEEQGGEYKLIYENPIESVDIDINVRPDWILRDYQVPIVKWFTNKSIGPLRATELLPGGGKTFSCISATACLKNPTLVICSGLLEQWKDNYYKITDIKEDDLFCIQGHPSLKKLFKEQKQYKIYLASTETLRSWISNQDNIYNDVPSYCQFLYLCNIGTKVVDEFHLNFSAITSIDFRSNVENNIYLSATPARSDRNSNRIFGMIFPLNTIYANTVFDKYVNCTLYGYRLDISNPRKLTNKFGYNHIKYEAQVCSNEDTRLEFFTRIIKPIIDSHYINKFTSGKLLVLVQTIQLVSFIVSYCEYYYPDKTVKSYTSSDPESNLVIGDIIISTPKSCGVGRDIKELVCCINLVSVSSEPLVKQIFGRLRKLPDGRTPEFVDMYNRLIPDQVRHMKSRRKIYEKRALKLDEFEI